METYHADIKLREKGCEDQYLFF